jgi:hypothetical protein
MVRRFSTALFLATTILAVAAAGGMAQAQKHGQKKGGGSMCQGMMCMMSGGAIKGPEHMAAMQAARIAYLKTALGITEAQTGVWNAYVEALKANQSKMKDMMKGMMKGKKEDKKKATAIEKMDARIARTKTKLQNLEAMKPVTEALYNALDAEQKKKADAVLIKGRGMM